MYSSQEMALEDINKERLDVPDDECKLLDDLWYARKKANNDIMQEAKDLLRLFNDEK